MLHEHPEYAFWVAGLLTLALTVVLLFLASTLDPKCAFSTTHIGLFKGMARWVREHLACCWNQVTKLFIEGDTQSYSLSKLQFLLWTVATVYGYTYLYIAHTWVQGLAGLPDVTGKFPWETVLAGGGVADLEAGVRNQGRRPAEAAAFGLDLGGRGDCVWADPVSLVDAGGDRGVSLEHLRE